MAQETNRVVATGAEVEFQVDFVNAHNKIGDRAGVTWQPLCGLEQANLFSSVAFTTTQTIVPTLMNINLPGVEITINTTVAPGGGQTLSVVLDHYDLVTATYFPAETLGTISGTGQSLFQTTMPVPQGWQVRIVPSGAGSWTASGSYSSLAALKQTAGGGGTQYTEGDTDASVTGTAVMWEDTSDTLRAASVVKPLPVQLSDGADVATVRDLTNGDALNVAIVDSSGNQITSFGGGVQYTEGDTDASITGTAVMWEDTSNTLRAVSAALPLPVSDAAAAASLAIIDDWDESDRAKVNPIAGQVGVQGASGVVTALTQRVVLATDVALPTGTNSVGRVVSGGVSIQVAASFTRPADTTAYAAGDAVTDSTSAPTAITFSGSARANGGTGIVLGALMVDSASQATKGIFELWLFAASPTPDNDNAVFTPTDAECATLVGVIPLFATYVGDATAGAGGNVVYESAEMARPFTTGGGSTSLFGLLVVRNSYTPVSAEVFTVCLRVLQN